MGFPVLQLTGPNWSLAYQVVLSRDRPFSRFLDAFTVPCSFPAASLRSARKATVLNPSGIAVAISLAV